MHLLDTSGGLANEAVGQRPDRPLAKSLKGSLANGGGSFKPLWDLREEGPLAHNLDKFLHA